MFSFVRKRAHKEHIILLAGKLNFFGLSPFTYEKNTEMMTVYVICSGDRDWLFMMQM